MRQTSMLSEDDDGNNDEEAETHESLAQEQEGLAASQSSSMTAHTEHAPSRSMESNTSETIVEDPHWAGFNGRCNKVADTCYSFWVGGSLGVSGMTMDYALKNAKSSSDSQESPPNRFQRESSLSYRENPAHHWRVRKAAWRSSRYVHFFMIR